MSDLWLIDEKFRILNFKNLLKLFLYVNGSGFNLFFLLKKVNQDSFEHIDYDHEVVEINLAEKWSFSIYWKSQDKEDVLKSICMSPVYVCDIKFRNDKLSHISEDQANNWEEGWIYPEALFPTEFQL